MPLVKLEFRPGVDKEGTNYENTQGWYDSNLVRFRFGKPEKIGGWVKRSAANQFVGNARYFHPWTLLNNDNVLAIGTHKKLYLDQGGALKDITPIRATTTDATNPFDVVDTSATITVNDTSHGAITGDYVTISDVSGDFNGISASEVNAEHVITKVDDNSYTITVTTPATSTANGVGGAGVDFAYQINVGIDTGAEGLGWGIDDWEVSQGGSSSRGWGDAAETGTGIPLVSRLWHGDNFGEDLVANVRDSSIYYWDASDGVNTRAEYLVNQAGASDVPTICRQILVSAEDRHLMAFGCNDIGSGDPDLLLIRWADQESIIDWTPDTNNTSGSLRLSAGSEIIAANRTRREILVWTDTTIYAIRFIGAPDYFGAIQVGTNTSLIAPNAVVEADSVVYWMGKNNFFVYSGTTQTLPCTLRSYVFSDINLNAASKIFAGLNRSHYEIWFFYPSLSSSEIDRYVVFNYMEQAWYHGNLERTAWHDRSFIDYPIAASVDGYVYLHENGLDDGSTDPVSAINAYIESSDFELPGDGYQFVFIRRIIPDITFENSTAEQPAVTVTVTPRDYPGVDYKDGEAPVITRSASTPVEVFTKHAFLRLRGRAVKYRIENTGTGVLWRDGSSRLEVRPDGRR